jgi:hypothetical protein
MVVILSMLNAAIQFESLLIVIEMKNAFVVHTFLLFVLNTEAGVDSELWLARTIKNGRLRNPGVSGLMKDLLRCCWLNFLRRSERSPTELHVFHS